MTPHRLSALDASLVEVQGERVVLRTSNAHAPGSPLVLEFEGRAVEARTLRCQRRSDGAFELRCRLVSATREDRAALLATVSSDRSGPGGE